MADPTTAIGTELDARRAVFAGGVTGLAQLAMDMSRVVKGEVGRAFVERLQTNLKAIEESCAIGTLPDDPAFHIGAMLFVQEQLMRIGQPVTDGWAEILGAAAIALCEWVGAHSTEEDLAKAHEKAVAEAPTEEIRQWMAADCDAKAAGLVLLR